MPGDLARRHDGGPPEEGDLKHEPGIARRGGTSWWDVCHGQEATPFHSMSCTKKDGMELAHSLSQKWSTRHWLDPFTRAKSSLSLKTYGPSDIKLEDETEDWTLCEHNGYNNGGGGGGGGGGHSSTATPDARTRCAPIRCHQRYPFLERKNSSCCNHPAIKNLTRRVKHVVKNTV